MNVSKPCMGQFLLAVLLVSLGLGPVHAAGTTSGDEYSYWTPEQLKRAKPMPLPRVKIPLEHKKIPPLYIPPRQPPFGENEQEPWENTLLHP
jgi:hypothetical protein